VARISPNLPHRRRRILLEQASNSKNSPKPLAAGKFESCLIKLRTSPPQFSPVSPFCLSRKARPPRLQIHHHFFPNSSPADVTASRRHTELVLARCSPFSRIQLSTRPSLSPASASSTRTRIDRYRPSRRPSHLPPSCLRSFTLRPRVIPNVVRL